MHISVFLVIFDGESTFVSMKKMFIIVVNNKGHKSNIFLFDGLTAHNGENQVILGLEKDWTFDEETCTYIFNLQIYH